MSNINHNNNVPSPNHNQNQKINQHQEDKKFKKEAKIKRIKKFCRFLEKNINNYINFNPSLYDHNRVIKGLYLKIDSVNGIKKILPKEKIQSDRKYFIRFFITFYNSATSQFFGNTYKSPLLNIRFNETGHYELFETEPLYVYFLSDANDTKNGIFGVLEILFVETSLDFRIISQNCEGWGMIELQESPVGKMGTPTQIFSGTPRNLMHRGMKNFIPINGASILYSCNAYPELLNLRFLLPNYTILGYTDVLPGLLMRTLPRKPVLNEYIKLTQFSDVYLKNVEINITPTLENSILEFAKKYRSQKYDLPVNSNLNPIIIKERKLKIGIHNTFTFVNSNGVQNSIPLTRKENALIFKGVSHVDNFFQDELCAFIFELNYYVSLPIMNNREDNLQLIIGYAVALPKKIGMDNKYKSLNLITGPGCTVYGENLLETLEKRDKYIKLNFILSKNKDSYDKTYKENEIERLKVEMNELKKNMQEEYTKQILNEKLKFDKEREDMLKRKEFELMEMESRLRESQRSLKAVYDKDDHYEEDYMTNDPNRHHAKHHHSDMQIQNNAINNLNNNNFDPNQSQQITPHILNNNNVNMNHNNNYTKNKNLFQEDQMNMGDNLVPEAPSDSEASVLGNKNNNELIHKNNMYKHNINNQFQNNENMINNPINPNFKNTNNNFSIHDGNMNNTSFNNNRYDNNQSNLSNLQNNNTITHPNANTSSNAIANMTQPNMNNLNNKFYNTDNLQNLHPNMYNQGLSTNQFNDPNNKQFYNTALGNNFDQMMHPNFNNQFNTNNNFNNPYMSHLGQFYNTSDPNLHLDNQTRDISRREKAELMSKGILNMQIVEKSLSLLNYTFENEIKDEKKANNFIISFLAFKPLPDIKDYKIIPNKIHFKFDFWDFDTFITKSAVINKPTADIIPSNTPLVITKEGIPISAKIEDKEMKIQIDFDPSIGNKMDFKEFINYLLTKNLFIEIYDSEKLNQIGHIKIPLRDFLRQGKLSIFHTKEYDIFDYNFMIKGSIQVLIKSVGYNCAKNFKYDPHYLKVLNVKDKYSNTNKKKVIKTNQIKLDKLSEINKENLAKAIIEKAENSQAKTLLNNNNQTIENQEVLIKGLKLNLDPETQKRLRALKYSSKPTSQGNDLNSILKLNKLEELKNKQVKENEFIQSLTYVNKIKEMNKKDIIEKTIQENNKNTVTIDLIAGQNHYFNFIIQNMENIDELVQIVITKQNKIIEGEKLDKNFIKENKEIIDKENVVTLVIDPEEWRTYVETNKLYKPDDYNIISPQSFLILRPRESIPLLLKIKSFDLNLKDETYVVWVYKKEGQPLYNLYLNIRRVFPILDHNYIYYLPENKFSNIKFPNPFKYDKIKIQKFLDYYYCTDSHVSVQLDSVSNEFFFKFKTNSEYSQSSFYLYIFMDEKKAQLFGTWKFDIFAVHNLDVHAQIGSKVVQKLNIEERLAKTVQFYSTNEEILYLPDKYNKPMVLIPNLSNEIRCVVNPKQNDTFEVLLNCVDISSRELIKTWLFRIMADKPEISHVHKIDCKINQVLNFKYEFANPLNHHMIFNFESNSNLLKIIDSRLPFNGGEKKLLNVSIPPQSQVGRAEVLMFVSDLEELYTETILFQLNFK